MEDKELQRKDDEHVDLMVEEFSIMELEDRLELVPGRCNHNCSCPGT